MFPLDVTAAAMPCYTAHCMIFKACVVNSNNFNMLWYMRVCVCGGLNLVFGVFLELFFVGLLWQRVGCEKWGLITAVCRECFIWRGHRQYGPLPATLKQQQQRSVWFHPGGPGRQLCSLVFPRFPGDHRGDREKGCRSLPTRVR